MTIKVFDTIRGAPTEPMVASQSMDNHSISVRKISKISKNPKIIENQRYLGQQKIQGTLGPSLALECKCAFGAKIYFLSFIRFFSVGKVRLRRTFVDPKISVRRQNFPSIAQRHDMGRAF